MTGILKIAGSFRSFVVVLLAIAALSSQPAPARAGLADCLTSVGDMAASISSIAMTGAAAAGCISAGTADPVMAATIVALTALAISGEFSGSDGCHAMINGAVGQLIALALTESHIADIFGKDAVALLISFAQGNAGAMLEELVPPITPYINCGCTVAGAAGDIAVELKALNEAAGVCKDFISDAAGAFVDAVDSGLDAIEEFFMDIGCSIGSCSKDWIITDCRNTAIYPAAYSYEIAGGGIATKVHKDDAWEVCYCPSPDMKMTAPDPKSPYALFCRCSDDSEAEVGGSGKCACPGNQHHMNVGGAITACRACAPGSTLDPATSQCSCGAGEMLVKAFAGSQTDKQPDACGVCPANGARQGAECVVCPAGERASDNWGKFDSNACEPCGYRKQVAADGHSCQACGSDQYVSGNFTCQTCDASKGDFLKNSGDGCFNVSECRSDQVAVISAYFNFDGAPYTSHKCGCAEGKVDYNGKCVPQLKCNVGQDTDYDKGYCVNKLFCGAGETVKITKAAVTGDVSPQDAEYGCRPCDAGTYADQATNTCMKCPGGSVSLTEGTCTCPGTFGNGGGVCRPCPIGWHATDTLGMQPQTCVKDETAVQEPCGLFAIRDERGICQRCNKGEMAILNKCSSMQVDTKIKVPDNPVTKAAFAVPKLNCGANEIPDAVKGGCKPCKKDEQAIGIVCVSTRVQQLPKTVKLTPSEALIKQPELAPCPEGSKRIGASAKCVYTAAPKGQRDVPERASKPALNCPPRMSPNGSGTRCLPDLDNDFAGGGGSRPGAGRGNVASPSGGSGVSGTAVLPSTKGGVTGTAVLPQGSGGGYSGTAVLPQTGGGNRGGSMGSGGGFKGKEF